MGAADSRTSDKGAGTRMLGEGADRAPKPPRHSGAAIKAIANSEAYGALATLACQWPMR
jgi:hypothetical protein